MSVLETLKVQSTAFRQNISLLKLREIILLRLQSTEFLKSKTRDPIVFNSSGNYYAPDGGTLRIMFGKNSKARELSEKKLLAFWKFDEGMGEKFIDIKDPQIKGILKSTNDNNKFEWVEGIGFGEGAAIKIDPSKYVDTGFEK